MADTAGTPPRAGRPVAAGAGAANVPAPPRPEAPARLTDLDNDTLRLVAAAAWTGHPGGGLFGACRRGRAVGTSGVSGVTIRWCAACVGLYSGDPADAAAAAASAAGGGEGGGGRHPDGLAAHVDAAVALFGRTSGVRVLTLADGEADDGDRCGVATPAVRAAVWRRVGAAAAACRLTSLAVRGTAAAVALSAFTSTAAAAAAAAGFCGAGLGVTGPPLRRLSLVLDTEDEDRAATGDALAAATAGIGLLAPTLLSLDLRWGGYAIATAPAGSVAAVLGGARLVALTELTVAFAWVGDGDAVTIGRACPRVTRCRLDVKFEEGSASGLGLEIGALPSLKCLTLLRLNIEGNKEVEGDGLPSFLAFRTLDELTVGTMGDESYFHAAQGGLLPDVAALGNPMHDAEPRVTVTDLADALTACAVLPRALTLANTALTVDDAEQVLGEPVAAATLEALTLPRLQDPTAACVPMAPTPRLRSLRLTLHMGHLHDDGQVLSRLWAGTPGLTHLAVTLCWKLSPSAPVAAATPGGGDGPTGCRRTAGLRLLLRTLGGAPCAATLTSLTLIAADGCPGLAASTFAPLAALPALASLNVANKWGWVRAVAAAAATAAAGRPPDADPWVTSRAGVAAEGDSPLAAGLRRLLPRVRLATPQ